jgi:rhomboid protease GluP
LIVINIIIGVSIARVNNAAHMGGLVAGVALGWLLAPRLRPRGISADGDQLLLDDAASLSNRLPALVAVLALFAAATWWVWRFWLVRSGLA